MKIILFLLFALQVKGQNLQELLKVSDRARGGVAQGVSWNVKIKSWENELQTERNFQVKAKDVNAYVETSDIGRFKGEVYLFNDRTIWFFKPSLKKPVSISARERLSGQAANGDIASTNYARDYIPKLLKKENINGQSTYVLLLKAKNKTMTYDQIKYWISEKEKLGIKAEFLTLSGKVFKTAIFKYSNSIKINGAQIPFVSEMIIQDALQASNKSILYYDKPVAEKISDNIFNINNISR